MRLSRRHRRTGTHRYRKRACAHRFQKITAPLLLWFFHRYIPPNIGMLQIRRAGLQTQFGRQSLVGSF
jgi:hypothetical protein